MELKKNLPSAQRLRSTGSCSTWIWQKILHKWMYLWKLWMLKNFSIILYLKLIFMLHRKGAIFLTNHDELKAFLGINYLMGINKLPSFGNYREVDRYIENDGTKNMMTKHRFQDNLQDLHFGNNGYYNKSGEGRVVYVTFWDYSEYCVM